MVLRRALSLVTAIGVIGALVAGCSSAGGPGEARAFGASQGVGVENRFASFLSPRNLRETVPDTQVEPRIDSRERGSRGFLDTRGVNQGPDANRPTVDPNYQTGVLEGAQRGLPASEDVTLGEQRFDSRQRVQLNFQNEPLLSVVQQVLGGILQVNYVANPDIAGTVTFRTAQPIPLSQVLPVLQDILARNNLAIRLINDVYQIGTLDELARLEANARGGSLGEESTRVIKLARGTAEDVAGVVNQLLPAGTTVTPYAETNTLVVRGKDADFDSVERLVSTLVDTGVGEQRVAIFQLSASPPEEVAERIVALFSSLGAPVNAIPLTTRNAVLVTSASSETLNDVRRIVREIDVDLRDKVSLRVLQLTHLNAVDVAGQLNAVFGQGVVAVQQSGDEQTGNRSNIVAAAIERATAGTDARQGGDQPRRSVLQEDTPSTQPIGANERVAQAADEAGGEGATEGGETEVSVPSAVISIVPDARNNALLINSSFEIFKRIRDAVAALDVPIGQVVIEANILEVDINDNLEYGVQWFLETNGFVARSSAGLSRRDPGGGGAVAVISGGVGNLSFDVVLSALQEITNVKVLSSPYLTVVDGAEARLSVGDQIPFTTASQTASSGGTVTVTQEIETRDTGVILNVTPRIKPDNTVLLQVEQEVSSAREETRRGETNPTIAQRNITSQITVESGRTALLGGLIIDRDAKGESGVPVLRRIPVLGAAFRYRSSVNRRTELLVLITPRVVRRPVELDTLTRQLRSFTYGQEIGIVKR